MPRTSLHVQERSVFENVSALLRDMMQDLAQPVRVREEDLAKKLGVSRTPVREALIRLESVGMVCLRPGRGALLNPVTDEEYLEWLQVRESLEGLAAREAALNASQRDVQRLRAFFLPFMDLDEDACPQDAYGQANVAFHQEVIALARNQLLARVWAAFGHRQTTYRRHTIARLHRFRRSLDEHVAVIAAIERRDAELAESLARQHVRSLHEDFVDALRAGAVAISTGSTPRRGSSHEYA